MKDFIQIQYYLGNIDKEQVMSFVPQWITLDEATSNIDTRTEVLIQKAFKKLMTNKTSFIIAHRLSTIIHSDLIIAMKDGHIMETGTHEELMRKKGFYYQIYEAQFVKEL